MSEGCGEGARGVGRGKEWGGVGGGRVTNQTFRPCVLLTACLMYRSCGLAW